MTRIFILLRDITHIRPPYVRLDPKLIIDFATIAEEGSFIRAARRLRVAQPWLSARIQKLEEILGFRLLERTTRSVWLTDRGREFLPAARLVAEASEAADRLALQLGRSNRSILRIGAAPYTKLIRRRRELIDAFARSHPKVSLELVTGWSLALLGRLDSGDVDLTFLMGDVDPARYEIIVLKQYGVALSMSRCHPLAGARSLTVEDVRGWPIQVYTKSLYPDLWDALYAPLIEANARFIEIPEMAEGPPDDMPSPHEIAAFFDFGPDESGTADVVRIPLEGSATVPFQLLRTVGNSSPAAQEFWDLTLESSGRPAGNHQGRGRRAVPFVARAHPTDPVT